MFLSRLQFTFTNLIEEVDEQVQRKKPCRKLQSEIKIHAGYGDNPATAERKNHANSDQKHFKTHIGNKSEEPSATESEILPLHKPAVYTKGFVLRRPSGGSQ